jgi:hypothetical protein
MVDKIWRNDIVNCPNLFQGHEWGGKSTRVGESHMASGEDIHDISWYFMILFVLILIIDFHEQLLKDIDIPLLKQSV